MWSFGKILARHPPSKEATKSVIRILRASPGGLTTQDLYKRLNRTRVVESNAGDTEAQPENPIRSMRCGRSQYYISVTNNVPLQTPKDEGVEVHARHESHWESSYAEATYIWGESNKLEDKIKESSGRSGQSLQCVGVETGQSFGNEKWLVQCIPFMKKGELSTEGPYIYVRFLFSRCNQHVHWYCYVRLPLAF